MLISAWPRLRRPPLALLAVLWPCARIRDDFWGRLFHTLGRMLLSHWSHTSPGCSGTVAVIITVQIGHCKCQQVLIGLSSNKTANVVKLLTWMQLYWYCRAYLVMSLSPPFGAVPWRIDNSCTPCRDCTDSWLCTCGWRSHMNLAALFLEQGSATPGAGLLWAAVRMWLLGLLVVCHGHLSASSPVPLCLEHPSISLALGLLVRSTCLVLFSPPWMRRS